MPFNGRRTMPRNNKITAMVRAGATRRQVGERFGLDPDYVHKICRILKATRQGAATKTERNNEIRRLRRLGRPLRELAKKFGVSHSIIRRVGKQKPYDGPLWSEIQDRRLH